MVNLLSAGFMRLWKSRSFWVSMTVMAGVGAFEAAYCWRTGRIFGEHMELDMRYMVYALMSGILLSAFCGLFIGSEYSDGGIRRKIAAGYTRSAVYLSNLTLCIPAGTLICLGYIAAYLAVGVPLLGFFRMEISTVLRSTLDAFLMTAALAAVFTMLSMLNHNKAVVVVASIFLAYFLLLLGIFLNKRLLEPEVIETAVYGMDNANAVLAGEPNPFYVGGVKRDIYQFLFALPGCQAMRVAVMETEWTMPACSGGVLAACTGLGLALFGRKNIR